MTRILTDSAADLTSEELERYGISVVPLSIHFGEDTYRDGETLDKKRFYELLQASGEFPKTSQPSPADFEGYFEDAKAAGDELIAVLLSSALSGTFQGACIAREMMAPIRARRSPKTWWIMTASTSLTASVPPWASGFCCCRL